MNAMLQSHMRVSGGNVLIWLICINMVLSLSSLGCVCC